MNQLQAHGALFIAYAGLDHALVERAYKKQMDELIVHLRRHYPIEVGHGMGPIEDDAGLTDLLARLHPFSAEFDEAKVPIEIRKNLWQLAYGESEG